jgi:hypothetical protein
MVEKPQSGFGGRTAMAAMPREPFDAKREQ